MPSLIYIARVQSLSEELAQRLRSAGCYVESFKPGRITQDECLLAMTADAADGALHPDTAGTERGRTCSEVPAAVARQVPGPEAALWDIMKTAMGKDFRANEQPAAAPSGTEPGLKEFASTAKQTQIAGSSPKARVNKQHPPVEPPPIVAVSSTAVSIDPMKVRPSMERFYRVLRNPLTTVATVLVFGFLYRGLPAITASGKMAGGSNASTVLAEPSRATRQTAQRRQSSDGTVAEDFTRRVAMQASTSVDRKDIGLKTAPRVSTQKRIVMD